MSRILVSPVRDSRGRRFEVKVEGARAFDVLLERNSPAERDDDERWRAELSRPAPDVAGEGPTPTAAFNALRAKHSAKVPSLAAADWESLARQLFGFGAFAE